MKVDLFKKFKLTNPIVCGLVLKVTSPKGIREFREETQMYHYNLHTELKQIYEGTEADLEPGLYWVVNVAKTKQLGLHWNHYLFIIDEEITLVEKYLNQKSSDWIVDALPTVKGYFRQLES